MTDENKRLNIKYVIKNFVCKASHTKKITSFINLVDGRLSFVPYLVKKNLYKKSSACFVAMK